MINEYSHYSIFGSHHECFISCDMCGKETPKSSSFKECLKKAIRRDGGSFSLIRKTKVLKKYKLKEPSILCGKCRELRKPVKQHKSSLFDIVKKILRRFRYNG